MNFTSRECFVFVEETHYHPNCGNVDARFWTELDYPHCTEECPSGAVVNVGTIECEWGDSCAWIDDNPDRPIEERCECGHNAYMADCPDEDPMEPCWKKCYCDHDW